MKESEIRKKFYREVVEFHSEDYDYDIDMIADYQIRIHKGSLRVDIFPKSGKFFNINAHKWGQIPNHDVERFLQGMFN